jgi:hypothetical protein
MLRSALLLLALLARAPMLAQEPLPWPFGTAGGRAGQGLDLWNLGMLGAKASDAGQPPPRPREGGRTQRISGSDDRRLDLGPVRLRVELLHPDGPAAAQGLRPGDVIVGLGRTPFDKGSVKSLAQALARAEAADPPVLSLLLERGPRARETLRITLPRTDRAARAPMAPAFRAALVRLAQDWLRGRQGEDGGFRSTLSGTNGAIVQTALAGLAWLCACDAEGEGPHAEAVQKARDFVLRHLYDEDSGPGREGGPNWNQTNWGLVHAGIFLGELALRRPGPLLESELRRIAAEIGRRQEASGGWAHGPGGKNALDYLELNIVTGLALSALGACARAGVPPDRAVLDRAMAYLEASGGGDGGVGYSTSPGQKGQGNIGRTAAAWLGAENAGLGRQPFTAKMRSYVRRNAGAVFDGHASLMQHILLAGVAASAQGGAAWRDFTEALEPELTLARAPDGSFQPRPWRESITMGSNSDVEVGEVWTTAAWAIVLGADGPDGLGLGLPGWRGAPFPSRR